VIDQGFKEPRNGRLPERVELLGAAALMDPTVGTEDEPEPTAAFFIAAASPVAFSASTT
jgi:hypothetical protein